MKGKESRAWNDRATKVLDAMITHWENRPETWTQGAYARRPDGVTCQISEPEAVKWCARGLVGKFAPSGVDALVVWHLDHEARTRDRRYSGILAFNDAMTTTVGDVLDIFRATRARLVRDMETSV